MTEQDREKKIAEIRKSAEEARKTDRSWVDGQDYADDVEFLLDELEQTRKERDKLIEGLRWYAKLNPAYTGHRAREILKEIGVTVE